MVIIGKNTCDGRKIILCEDPIRDFEPVLQLIMQRTHGHKWLELGVIIFRWFLTIYSIIIKHGDGLQLLVFFGHLRKLPLVLTWEQLQEITRLWLMLLIIIYRLLLWWLRVSKWNHFHIVHGTFLNDCALHPLVRRQYGIHFTLCLCGYCVTYLSYLVN